MRYPNPSTDRVNVKFVNITIQDKKLQLNQLETQLKITDPAIALQKGFAISTSEKGNIIRSVSQVKEQETMIHHFKDGKIKSIITKITNND